MADDQGLKARTVTSLLWKLFERGSCSIASIIVQIVLARLLAPEQFGMLAIMLVFVNVGNVFVQSGLNTALIQAPKADSDAFTTVFWMCLTIAIILYMLVFIVAPLIADFYEMSDLTWPLRALSLILIINSYNSVQVARATRNLEFKKISIATIVSVFISGALGIAAAWLGFGLWALVLQQLSMQVITCVALAFQVEWKPSLTFNPSDANRLFSFGWKLLASGLIDVGYQSFSDLVIGRQFSATQLGFVTQGKRYPTSLGASLDGAIQPVMLSAVSRVQNNVAYVKRLVRRALKTSTYIVMPCMTFFALVAEPFVSLLFGDQWLPCVFFLQVYCFSNALLPMHTTNLQALNAMGRSDLFFLLEIIKKSYGLVLLLVAAFVLHDIYLMVGSYLLTGIISTFVNAYPNKQVIGYSYGEQIRDILPGLTMAAISAAIAWPLGLLSLPDASLIVLQGAIMTLAYLGMSKLFHVEAFEYLMTTLKEMVISLK